MSERKEFDRNDYAHLRNPDRPKLPETKRSPRCDCFHAKRSHVGGTGFCRVCAPRCMGFREAKS